MMYEPTIRIVFLLQVLFIITFLTAPIPVFFSFLGVNTILLTLHSWKFRTHLSSLIKLSIVWIFFLAIVGTGRVIGGTRTSLVWEESIRRLSFFTTTVFVMMLAYLYIKPIDYLRIFDRSRVPREISYIFLSVISLIDYVRTMGQRQLHLLEVKGLGPKGIRQRVNAYYRILGPLFSILLSRQVIHSRSMAYRSFYEGKSKTRPDHRGLQPSEVRWIVMALLNFVSCLLISVWLSR